MDRRFVPHGEFQDDIIAVASPSNGRGYFLNAGDTLRQGFEAGVTTRTAGGHAYTNYAFIDATFQSANILSSPDNHDGRRLRMSDPSDPGTTDR